MEESKDESKMKNQKNLKKLTIEEKKELYEGIEYDSTSHENAKKIFEIMEDIDEEIDSDLINGGSALMVSCRYRRKELVKYLIGLGADVNKTINGYSPLMRASSSGNIQIIQLLIDAGADLSYVDCNGRSALSQLKNNVDIFELLISSGVDIRKCGDMALINASANKNINIVERLLQLGEVNVNCCTSNNGWTSLHYACQRNNLELVKVLLHGGADENTVNKEGRKPIELTRSNGIIEFIKNYQPTNFVLK